MHGLGTIVNCAAISVGGVIGTLFGKRIKEDLRDGLLKILGVCVIITGLSGTLSQMLTVEDDGKLGTQGALMMIVCLAAGTLIGELIGIEKLLEKFGAFLKSKFAKNDEGFTSAFVNASFVVCVGAMAVVGSLQDGLAGDHATLFEKSLLDFLIILAMASGMGIGCSFSAIPVAIIQGGITLCAKLLEPVLNVGTVISDISLVGNVMIACIGINLSFGKKFRVGNMLPALVLTIAWSLINYKFF